MRLLIPCAVLFGLAGGIAVAIADESTPVDFRKEVLPVLTKNCTACHNDKKPEGGLSLDSVAAMQKGGDSGPSIVANDVAASVLLERILATDDSVMPPPDNSVGAVRLTPEEIDRVRRWIETGAVDNSATPEPLSWNHSLNNLEPVYSIATAANGMQTVVGRGSEAFVVGGDLDVSSVVPLVDRSLQGDPRAHEDFVQSVAISRDDQWIATGGFRTVKLWKRQDGTRTLLDGLGKIGPEAALSMDGRYVAYARDDRRLVIADRQSNRATELLKAHAARITTLVWFDDVLLGADAAGQFSATRMSDWATLPIDAAGLKPVSMWVRWTRDRLAAIDNEGKLAVINVALVDGNAKLTPTSVELPATATSIAADRNVDSPHLAVGLSNGQALVWKAATEEAPTQIGVGAGVSRLVVDGLSARLLSSGNGQFPKLWSLGDGKLIAELQRDEPQTRQFELASGNVARQQIVVDKLNGQMPGLQEAQKKEVEAKTKVAETRTKAAEAVVAVQKEVDTAKEAVTAAEKAVTDIEAEIAAAMKRLEEAKKAIEAKQKTLTDTIAKKTKADEELAKRDQALATATASEKHATDAIPQLEARINAESELLNQRKSEQSVAEAAKLPQTTALATFTRDGRQLLLTGADNTLRRFAADMGQPIATSPLSHAPVVINSASPGEVYTVSTDGVWQSHATQPDWTLVHRIGSPEQSPFSHRITALDFSPDSQLLAVGGGEPSRGGEIHLINVSDGQIAKAIENPHSDTVLDVQFSPSGRYLASAGADKLAKVFETGTGELFANLEGHSHHVLGIAWRHDEQVLATSGADAAVRVWSLDNGSTIRTIGGASKEATGIAFVPGTSHVVVSSVDGVSRLQNVDDGKTIRTFGGYGEPLYAVSVSPQLNRVVAAGQKGQVVTWVLESGEISTRYPAAE